MKLLPVILNFFSKDKDKNLVILVEVLKIELICEGMKSSSVKNSCKLLQNMIK